METAAKLDTKDTDKVVEAIAIGLANAKRAHTIALESFPGELCLEEEALVKTFADAMDVIVSAFGRSKP